MYAEWKSGVYLRRHSAHRLIGMHTAMLVDEICWPTVGQQAGTKSVKTHIYYTKGYFCLYVLRLLMSGRMRASGSCGSTPNVSLVSSPPCRSNVDGAMYYVLGR